MDREHVYHVSQGGVLTHNVGAGYYDATDFIVYMYDKNGKVYVGHTRKDWRYRYGKKPPGWRLAYRGLTYEQARGLEDRMIRDFKAKGISANINNGVSPRNPNAKTYAGAANKYKGCR